ncbi:MAG: hypothetical protein OEZ33_08710 [Gammaproteobacteria bacterium]|nr:hypothetical protein [Gammaproteobacteria bacterium]
MTAIKINVFGGIAPRIDPSKLQESQSQTAENCRLFSGSLESWKGSANDVLLATSPVTMFRYSPTKWLQWAVDVDVVRSPVPDDQFGRVYWTGDGDPKMGVSGNIDSVAPYPTNSYTLGIPAPSTKLSGVIATNLTPPAGASPEEKRTVYYVYTYVSAYGEEGPPSPVSDQFEPSETEQVNLSAIANPGAGDHNITIKRIYRTLDGEYVFVADIPVANTTFNDNISDIDTGLPMVSESWYAPSATMQGLTALPNGILAGFKGNEVRMSEPYYPHAWPPEYSLSTDHQIVALGKISSAVVVLTKGHPYIAHGVHPSGYTLETVEIDQSCVSKKSVVETGRSVIYASPDGLVSIPSSNPVVTEELMKKREWQALNPSSIVGVFHDQRYYGFYDATSIGGSKGGFILDPGEPLAGMVMLTQYTECLYADLEDDVIYYVDEAGTQIKKWDSGAADLNYTWKSKRFIVNDLVNFGWFQIRADSYPVTYTIYADSAQVATGNITDIDPVRLPSGFLSDEWEIKIEGNTRVRSVALAESAEEL